MANIIEYEENDAWPDGKDSLQHKNEPHICTYRYILVIKFFTRNLQFLNLKFNNNKQSKIINSF